MGPGRRHRPLPAVVLVLVAGLLVVPPAACGPPAARAAADVRLQAVLDCFAARPLVAGVVASVTGPDLRFRGAAGRRALLGGPIAPDTPFRTASVTKVMTAAAVLRLVEQDRLALDDPVARHLWIAALDGRTTVRHLLLHTGGLADYGTDPAWLAAVATHPQRVWQPAELAALGLRHPPRAAPGVTFHYSDTGYVLLGLIVERVTGRPLAQAYRELLPLDLLPATHLEGREPPSGDADRAHPLVGLLDLAGTDPSFDNLGGGGLVSTAPDLDAFVRALVTDRVFSRPATLDLMRTTVPAGEGARYGLGIGTRRLAGEQVWLHTGFFGAFIAHVPRLDLTLAGSTNQNLANPLPLLTALIHAANTSSAVIPTTPGGRFTTCSRAPTT